MSTTSGASAVVGLAGTCITAYLVYEVVRTVNTTEVGVAGGLTLSLITSIAIAFNWRMLTARIVLTDQFVVFHGIRNVRIPRAEIDSIDLEFPWYAPNHVPVVRRSTGKVYRVIGVPIAMNRQPKKVAAILRRELGVSGVPEELAW